MEKKQAELNQHLKEISERNNQVRSESYTNCLLKQIEAAKFLKILCAHLIHLIDHVSMDLRRFEV